MKSRSIRKISLHCLMNIRFDIRCQGKEQSGAEKGCNEIRTVPEADSQRAEGIYIQCP